MEALITRWQEPLWRHAARLIGDPNQADDILQEALVSIVRQISKLSEPGAFRAWAYRIVKNKAADHIRKNQRQRQLQANATESSLLNDDETDLSNPVELIRAAMKRLNHQDRIILSLFYLDEMSIAEVSQVCGIPFGTVKSRLFKARENLRKILDLQSNSNQ